MTYTGQRDYSSVFRLMNYNARFYSPSLGRFTQPDSVVPAFEYPQSWNRFSYVTNNPVNFTDSSGHCADALTVGPCVIMLSTSVPILAGVILIVAAGVVVGVVVVIVADRIGTPITLESNNVSVYVSGSAYYAASSTHEDEEDITIVNEGNLVDEWEDAELAGEGDFTSTDKTGKTKKQQKEGFDRVIKRIEDTIGRNVTPKEKRRIHDWLSGQGFNEDEIYEEGLDLISSFIVGSQNELKDENMEYDNQDSNVSNTISLDKQLTTRRWDRRK